MFSQVFFLLERIYICCINFNIMKHILLFLTLSSVLSLVSQERERKYCDADTVFSYEYLEGSSLKQKTRREIYTYEKGVLKDVVYQNWNKSKLDFINDSKSSGEYNTNGNTTLALIQVWDTVSNFWVNNSMTKFEISTKNNKETERSYFLWQKASNKWRHTSRNTTEYDADNNISTYSTENYNTKTDTLLFTSKSFYSYYSNNNLKEIYYQNYDETISDWVNVQKIKYSYNANNKLTETRGERWSAVLGDWQNLNKRTIVFNANNLETENKLEVWNSALGLYENRSLVLKSYGAKNTLFESKDLSWDNVFNAWDSTAKYMCYYNSDYQIDSVNNYYWNYTGPWKLTYKTKNFYDNRGSMTKTIDMRLVSSTNLFEMQRRRSFEFDSDTFVVAEETGNGWNATNNEFDDRTRTEYSCPFNKNTGVLNLESDLFLVFPNPATSNIIHVSVSGPSLYKIYNKLGAIVSIGSFEKGINSIEISKFAKGIYFIKTQTNTQKIIIQ